GEAFQLTNFLRDVAEDLRRGRIYLPQEDLAGFGVTRADLAAGLVTVGVRELLRFEIARTRRLYRHAYGGIRMLAPSSRHCVETAHAGEDTTEVWAEAGKAGLLGLNIPTEYGGSGAGIYELHIVTEESAAAGVPLLFLPVSAAICATVLTAAGTEEQRRRW